MLSITSCGQRGVQVGSSVEYDVTSISKSNITFEQSYPVSIEGRQSIKIIPRVEGYLQEVKVKEGQKVSKGQILFVLDQSAYLAELNAAEANADVVQASVEKEQLNYEGSKQLHAKKIVSDFDLKSASINLEMAQAQARQARAQLDAARTNLSYTVLRSPSDGVVGSLPYRKGDFVGPTLSEGLTTIADNKQMYVYFSLSERDVMNRMSEYGNMEKTIDAFPPLKLRLSNGMEYSELGQLESISGVVESKTGALSARAVFPNTDGRLLSGSTGMIVVPQEMKDVIVIPQTATYEIQDRVYAYKVVGGMAESVIVSVLPSNDGEHYVVVKGLTEGDRIVASGASYVKEGQRIESK